MNNKVLIVAEYGILNGGERSLLAILPQLIRDGWQISVLLPIDTEFSAALRTLDIPVVPLSKRDEDGIRFDQFEMRKQLAELFASIRPDLIHCNSLATSRWCAPVARELNIPAVGYLRDIVKLSRRATADINQLDRIIAVSVATRNWHVAGGMDAEKISVIHNGVDLKKFRPLDKGSVSGEWSLHTEVDAPAGSPLLLFVGQIGMRKGVDLLLDAFAQIAGKFTDAHLLIVGERNSNKQEAIEFENRLHESQAQMTAGDRVHWLGRRSDVARLMRRSTVLIHPARQEPLGRVLLEAVACGLPIVTTNVGGSSEILNELKSFELLQAVDGPSIANRVMQLLATPVERSEISQRLHAIAQSRFSNDVCAAKVAQVYRQLIAQPD